MFDGGCVAASIFHISHLFRLGDASASSRGSLGLGALRRFGFSFRYPAGVFEPERRTEAGDGEVFADVGGHARLLVGAFENAGGYSVQSYMNYIRSESYSGYDIDYARRGQTWFVLSGENDQNVFYEKVMFSCNGRVISSFALIYPIASKAVFDPVVEGIEKTFRPGQSCGPYARSSTSVDTRQDRALHLCADPRDRRGGSCC